jgi:hypothetical protein
MMGTLMGATVDRDTRTRIDAALSMLSIEGAGVKQPRAGKELVSNNPAGRLRSNPLKYIHSPLREHRKRTPKAEVKVEKPVSKRDLVLRVRKATKSGSGKTRKWTSQHPSPLFTYLNNTKVLP